VKRSKWEKLPEKGDGGEEKFVGTMPCRVNVAAEPVQLETPEMKGDGGGTKYALTLSRQSLMKCQGSKGDENLENGKRESSRGGYFWHASGKEQ